MTKQVQRRRGTSTQHTSFTGAEGEISVNTTNKSVHVHDGVTAGGFEAARADLANVSDANLNNALSGNTLASLTITSADINGGTIDGATIGGTTPAAATFASATVNGNITVTGTVDGRDLSADGSKLDGIEAGADVTDTANVTAAGALMDSELTNIAAVKALNQGVSTTDSPTFAGATVSGDLTIADKIVHSGDTNTAIRFPAADTVTVETNGSERVRIDSVGNVGIGTSSPSSYNGTASTRVLAVGTTSGNNGVNVISGTTSTGSYLFSDSGGNDRGGLIYYHTADTMTMLTAGTERMRIDSAGKVGIGMTPTGALSIRPSGTGSEDSHIGFGANLDTYITTGADGIVVFREGNGAGANTERMRIDASGNLLVGGTSTVDSSKLYVVGNISQSGAQFNFRPGSGVQYELVNRVGAGFDFYVNNATNLAARLNASGNLGLGVTPSAWASGKAVEINATGNAIAGFGAGDLELFSGAYYNAGYKYSGTGLAAANYRLISGSHQWFTAPSGTAGNAITFTQGMTLDSQNSLLLGKTANTYGAANRTTFGINGAADSVIALQYAGSNGAYMQVNSTGWYLWNTANTPIVFSTSNAERARIDATGNLLVGKTAANTVTTADGFELLGSSAAAFCTVNTSGAANTWHLYNRNATNNGYRFYVKVDGGVVNFSANNVNLSDERVKTDIAPVGSYWDKIKALQVVTYKYKDQSHDDDNIGVIAQQVESVAPEFVSNDGFGETPEDGVPLKSIYEADLHYATLKALQEAMARIEVLEARIAALET